MRWRPGARKLAAGETVRREPPDRWLRILEWISGRYGRSRRARGVLARIRAVWRGKWRISPLLWAVITLALMILVLLIRKPNDELVHNERVKLCATALANLGVAAFIYGLIAPWLGGTGVGEPALGFVLCIIFVAAALLILRLLRPPPKN